MNDLPLIQFLLVLPLAGALAALVFRRGAVPRFMPAAVAVGELGVCFTMLFGGGLRPDFSLSCGGMLGLDSLAVFFLTVTVILFSAVAVYCVRWLKVERKYSGGHDADPRMPDWLFVFCMLFFVETMFLVICARNFGILWVAVEGTTLASAPLICHRRSAHSLEAMWKYLLICSVGIGFALFGTMFLSAAGRFTETGMVSGLDFDAIAASGLNPDWYKAAFLFLLAGYGTKMGLAPFHTWLPDAHSESPAAVSALLSGTLLNCAFLGIIRVYQVAPAAADGFADGLLIVFGLISVGVAALFIIRQTDFKRMLAYSSVEHMGLIALGWGLGAVPAALFHALGHTMIKGMLFLTAGNLLLAFSTRRIADVGGLLGRLPRNGWLWLIGLAAICGTPPSPLFVTEFMIVRQALYSGRPLVAGGVLLLLFAVFSGMSLAVLRMCVGKSAGAESPAFQAAEKLSAVPAVLAAAAMVCGGILLWFLICGGL